MMKSQLLTVLTFIFKEHFLPCPIAFSAAFCEYYLTHTEYSAVSAKIFRLWTHVCYFGIISSCVSVSFNSPVTKR